MTTALFCSAAAVNAGSVRWLDRAPEDADEVRWLEGESDSAAADHAAAWLSARGYFWPRLQAEADTLRILAGPRGQLGDVHITGTADVTQGELAAVRQALGDEVDAVALRQAMQALVSQQVDRGRPFTQVRLLALDISNPPAVNFELAVYSGPEVYAGSLVTKAPRTEPRVFEREAGWRRGVLLESDLIAESERRLETLPYVASVDTALLLSVAGDTADLYLGVRETPGVHAEGVLGWVPASSGAEGYWAGEFGVELRSAFGDGRTIGLQAARPDPQSQRTRAHFWEPWPWGAPLWLGAEFGQEDYARDFIETQASIAVRLATREPRWQFGGGWGRVTLEDEPSAESFPAEYWRAGIAAIDTGATSSYRFEFQWSSQRLSARDSLSPPQAHAGFTQGNFAAHRWLALSRTLHLRGLAAGAGTLLGSTQVPSHLLYRVGGIHTLRGYREQQFAVRDFLRVAWEGHLGSRQQSLFVFVEAAWLNFQSSPDQILGSVGAGLNIAGRVQLVAGVPSQGGLSETKIHVSVNTGR
jgi:outer membrane protein assembly factor BamA